MSKFVSVYCVMENGYIFHCWLRSMDCFSGAQKMVDAGIRTITMQCDEHLYWWSNSGSKKPAVVSNTGLDCLVAHPEDEGDVVHTPMYRGILPSKWSKPAPKESE